jgi:hypothetical protein
MTKYATAGRPVRSFSKSWSWLVVFMHVRFHQKIRIQMVHTAPSPDKQGHKSFDLRFSASIKGYLPAAHTCRSRWHPIQSVEKLVILLAHPIRSDPMQQQPPKLAGLPWVNAHHGRTRWAFRPWPSPGTARSKLMRHFWWTTCTSSKTSQEFSASS